MPKKKLTKAQVKRKLKAIINATYDLTLDKLGHPDSFVPISMNKLLDRERETQRAFNRLK
jgi:hypothetical protein